MSKFQQSQAAVLSHDQAQDHDRVQRLGVALAAALFGIFLFLGVGFAHSETIHNSTHDSRHFYAVPCH
ncbi:CbtB-domain containing protein [Rhodospirillaceae bacterium KN72]|uniref:CbtB-domain containing protein n=1 Tax=Pacificispira spongiicola TaxID=2729598 RepID=A0A7Y0HFZ6_9PROT|nr:CbtB domain-containing protein [Pacificispira spongiicola]NMM45128.1 CbtB-domain containing protein [Pacificispira spongiicola]